MFYVHKLLVLCLLHKFSFIQYSFIQVAKQAAVFSFSHFCLYTLIILFVWINILGLEWWTESSSFMVYLLTDTGCLISSTCKLCTVLFWTVFCLLIDNILGWATSQDFPKKNWIERRRFHWTDTLSLIFDSSTCGLDNEFQILKAKSNT